MSRVPIRVVDRQHHNPRVGKDRMRQFPEEGERRLGKAPGGHSIPRDSPVGWQCL